MRSVLGLFLVRVIQQLPKPLIFFSDFHKVLLDLKHSLSAIFESLRMWFNTYERRRRQRVHVFELFVLREAGGVHVVGISDQIAARSELFAAGELVHAWEVVQ